MRSLRVQWLVGTALAAASVVSVQVARAADAPASSGDSAAAKPADDGKGDKKDDQPEEKILHVGVDAVLGASATTVVNITSLPGQNGPTGTSTYQRASITNYSFLFDGGIKLTPGFGLAVRIPVEGATLNATPVRSDGAVGNLEVGAGGLLKVADMVGLELALGFTFPTAGGTPIPPGGLPAQAPGATDQSGYDRYALQRATSMSRGYEDDELFQPNHFGINPYVRLAVGQENKWHLDPWIKYDALVATSSASSFIGELLFGANAGVFLAPQVEPALRIWVNVPLTGADFTSAVAVVEPQLRFHFGPVTPYVGGILPIAGSLTSPYDFGIRVGISARF